MKYDRQSFSDTLAAMLIFSDEFMRLCTHLSQGISFYKICVMLAEYKKHMKSEKDINQVNEHIAFYRNQLLLAINIAEESLSELAEDDSVFISHLMTETSDALGIICDKLLENYGYGDIPDLMDSAEGVDLSDFIVDFYHSHEEDDDYDEDFDETDY